jgi:FtsZ-binding cell division protein ZapB
MNTGSGGIYSPAYYYNSDRRLKENIQDIKGLDSILGLRGVTFTWKQSGEKEIGLIAQEVEKVLPVLVKTNSDTGIKSVKYGNLVAPLIEAIKELYRMIVDNIKFTHSVNKEVQQLKEENARLKADNAQIKADVEELKRAIRKK